MGCYYLVEFLIEFDRLKEVVAYFDELDPGIDILSNELEIEQFDGVVVEDLVRLKVRIYSEVLTLIKLSNEYLSSKMKIYSIPDDLKDKYRR